MRRNRRNSAPHLEQLDDRVLLSSMAGVGAPAASAQVRALGQGQQLRMARIQRRANPPHLVTPQRPFRGVATVPLNTNFRATSSATAANTSAASTDASPVNATNNPYYFPVATTGTITPDTPIFDASPTGSTSSNPPVNATGNPYYHPVPTSGTITPDTPIFD